MPTATTPRYLGAVLAGGRSSRFGSDKAAALLDGRTLLDHALAGLAPHVDQLAVCGRVEAGRLCLPDRPRPDLGPLGGLAGGLRYAADHGFVAVLTTGCDMPSYPPALAAALIGEGPAMLDRQPLAAFWPSALADRLDAWLAQSDDRSLAAWARYAGARRVMLPGAELPNINHVADLEYLADRFADDA